MAWGPATSAYSGVEKKRTAFSGFEGGGRPGWLRRGWLWGRRAGGLLAGHTDSWVLG